MSPVLPGDHVLFLSGLYWTPELSVLSVGLQQISKQILLPPPLSLSRIESHNQTREPGDLLIHFEIGKCHMDRVLKLHKQPNDKASE
jgi:hypothetical protein